MKISKRHPREQIVEFISRIYTNGLTTTSGGNLSIMDEEGSVWITPKGIDKGTLTPDDIVRVRRDGIAEGRHEPSSEYPFHHAVYCARPDIRAIAHAHPPALAAFAITRTIPETKILPTAFNVCGTVGYAPYVLPGSRELGAMMSKKFGEGFSCVLMENHGIVTVGESMGAAFRRLETLDFCARTELNARVLGGARALTEEEISRKFRNPVLDEWTPEKRLDREPELRSMIVRFLRRCYAQKLMTAVQGTCSARVDGETLLITPESADRLMMHEDDLVLVRRGEKEAGKKPDTEVLLHQEIYRKHPGVHAILTAQPPHVMAFGVSNVSFDSRTIPESYLVLKTVVTMPFGSDDVSIAEKISEKTPIVLRANDSLVVTGGSLLQCFDRLEVAEFSARSIIASKAIGTVVPIGESQIAELEQAFNI